MRPHDRRITSYVSRFRFYASRATHCDLQREDRQQAPPLAARDAAAVLLDVLYTVPSCAALTDGEINEARPAIVAPPDRSKHGTGPT